MVEIIKMELQFKAWGLIGILVENTIYDIIYGHHP